MGINKITNIKLLRKAVTQGISTSFTAPPTEKHDTKTMTDKVRHLTGTGIAEILSSNSLADLADNFFKKSSYQDYMELGKKVRSRIEVKNIGFEDYPELELTPQERKNIYSLCKQWLNDSHDGYLQTIGLNGNSEWFVKTQHLARDIISLNFIRDLNGRKTSVGHFNIEINSERDELNIAPFSSVTGVTLMLGILETAKQITNQKKQLF